MLAVEASEVTGAEPAAGRERVAVELGIEVADEHLGPADEELARGAGRDVGEGLGIDDPQLGPVDQAAVGGRVALRIVAEAAGGERRVLRGAVGALAPASERARPSRTIAGATPAPPSENSRTDDVSAPPNVGSSIIVRMNTGVLIITAMCSRSTSSRARAGSHVSMSTAVIADVTGRSTPYVSPATCVIGIGKQEALPGTHVVRGRDRVGLDPEALVGVHDALRVRRRARRPEDHRRVVGSERTAGTVEVDAGSGASPRTSITGPAKPVSRTSAG